MEEQKEGIVPDNEAGFQTNTESVAELNSTEEAKSFFSTVRERFLNVSNWQHWAGKATADFKLTDEKGNLIVDRTPQKGDHFKIDIPGPGPATGDGYDWVQIEEIQETSNDNDESVCIRVRPATNPTNDHDDVAHFFSDDATSSFVVKREGNKVMTAVYGRNEKPNTKAETILDKARNTAIASGAISGLSKLQWKSLVDGLLKREI